VSGRAAIGRGLLGAAAGASLVLAVSALAVDRFGRSRRAPVRVDPPTARAVLVADSAAVARQWQAAGLRGRELVYASRFLHFVAPPESVETPGLEEFPYASRLDGGGAVDHRNLLWVAVRRDVARRVEHLVPESVLREKAGEGAPTGPLRTQEFGTPRSISDRVEGAPAGSTLGIDAALLTASDGPELAERLLAERNRFDVVVFNLAQDNPAVDDVAREALRGLAARWDGAGRVPD